MSDSSEPSWPGSQEVENLVSRAVAERVEPVRAQLMTVGRALAILAQRAVPPQRIDELAAKVDALTDRLREPAPADASLAYLDRVVKARLDELGTELSGSTSLQLSAARSELAGRLDAVASRLERSLTPLAGVPGRLDDVPDAVTGALEAALVRRDAEARRVQGDDLRQAVAAAVEDIADRAVARIEATGRADLDRIAERLAALDAATTGDAEARHAEVEELRQAVAASLSGDADARHAQTEELRQALAVAVSHAVAKVEQASSLDNDRLLERIAALEAPLARDATDRRAQAEALRQAVASCIDEAVAHVEAAHGTDTSRVLEHVTALSREAEARQAQAEEFRQTVTGAIEQAVVWIESAVTSDNNRILDQIAALEAPLAGADEGRKAQADELRTTIASALDGALKRIEAARTADATVVLEAIGRLEATRGVDAGTFEGTLGQIEAARTAGAARVEGFLAEIEAARAVDAGRLFEQVAALEVPLTRDAVARQAQMDDLRHTVATTIDQAVSRIETAHAADAAQLGDSVGALAAAARADTTRRDEQAAALLAALDDRLQSLLAAGTQVGAASEGRLAVRLGAVASEGAATLLARIDERTAPLTDLDALPVRLAGELHEAAASALASQIEPLVSRLIEAIDTLAHEGGRIEALARGQAGEARAVEERVVAMFAEVAERAESAVDRSRGRIAEGQVALGGRFDSVMAELLTAVGAATDRLEARLTESAEGLRAAGGHQNGALLDAVSRNGQRLSEGLAEVRTTLRTTGADAERLAERVDSLRASVESIRQDPRLEVLVLEQVAAREAQLAALDAVAGRIDEVGPIVARALLPEVERAARAASSAEDTIARLRPDELRASISEPAAAANEEVQAAARRLDQTIAVIADQVSSGLATLADGQTGLRADVAELQRPTAAATSRLDELDHSLSRALAELAGAVHDSRAELLSLTGQGGFAIDDLRSSQSALRAAVEDGAHKAELAALDIRGLRDRLTPHLVALAEATTRRAEADQAGFDAVLARLDQLLTARQR